MRKLFIYTVAGISMLLPVYVASKTAEPSNKTITMHGAVNAMGEFCETFALGEQVSFEFSSVHKLNFNIHYHTDNATKFPIKQVNISEFAGSFVVEEVTEQCFMWSNKTKRDSKWNVELTYAVLDSK